MGERVLTYDPATKQKAIVEVDDADAFEADAKARGLLYGPDTPENRVALKAAIASMATGGAPVAAATPPATATPHTEPDADPDADADDGAQGPSKADSALRGAGQSASFGFGDEAAGIGAWLASLSDSPAGRQRTSAPGVNAPIMEGNEYTRGRDVERAANQAAREANPGAFLGGELVGGALTAAAPIGGAARGATLLGRAANAAKAGAGIGALAGFGSAEGTAAQQAAQTAGGAALGGVIGGGAVPVVEGAVVPATKWATGKAGKFGDWMAEGMGRTAQNARAHANDMRLKRVGASKPQITKLQQMSDAGVTAYPDDEGMTMLRGGKDRYAEDFRRLDIKDLESAAAAYNKASAGGAELERGLVDAGAGVSPSDLARDIRAIGQGQVKAGLGKKMSERADELAGEFAGLGGERKRTIEIPPTEPETAVTERVEYPLETITHQIPANLKRGAAGRFERGGPPTDVTVDVVDPVDLTTFQPNPPTRVDVTLPEQRIPWEQARAERGRWGASTNFAAGSPDQIMRQQVYGAQSGALERAADEAIPGSGAAWRQAQNDKHMGLTALSLGGNSADAAVARNMLSPSDKGAGALTMLGTGNPLTALAVTGGNNILRRNVTPAREAAALGQERFARWLAEGMKQAPGTEAAAVEAAQRAGVSAPARFAPTFNEGFAAHPLAADDDEKKRRGAAGR